MKATKRSFPILVAVLLGGCVHSVSGQHMKIGIKRAPVCKVDVKMDGKLVFEGTAAKPCPNK